MLAVLRAQAVVYVTRSAHKAENEGVVTRCVEHSNTTQQKKTWRLSAPVLPLNKKNLDLGKKYLARAADHRSSGFFVAVITKEVCLSSRLLNCGVQLFALNLLSAPFAFFHAVAD